MAAIFPADHEWTLLDTVAEQEAANFDHPTADDNAEEDVHAKRTCVEQVAITTPSKLELASTVHGFGLVACCVVLALLVAALPLHAPAPPPAIPLLNHATELDALHTTLQQELNTNAALQAQLQDAHRAVHRARARADHYQQLLLVERRRADNLLGMLDAVHRAAHAPARMEQTSCGAQGNKHESLAQQLMMERTARMALETAALHDAASNPVAACWQTMEVLEQVQVNMSLTPGTLVRTVMRGRHGGSM